MYARDIIYHNPQLLGYVGLNTFNTFTDSKYQIRLVCPLSMSRKVYRVWNKKCQNFRDSSFTRMAVYVELDGDFYLHPFVKRGPPHAVVHLNEEEGRA